MSDNNNKIVLLNDGMYKYELPKPPSKESDIINFNLPKSEQFWHPPEIKNIKNLSAKDKIDYIERERQRWVEGVYVLINGELTYLTGMHYDHLTYMTFKGIKAEFFQHQIHDFYFRDLTWKDKNCRGRVWMKPRRYGMTMEEITEASYRLLENFSNNVGLQSDTPKKVRTTLMTPIINSYVKRPRFMRSDYYKPNGKLLVSEISLNNNLAPDEDGSERGDYLLGWMKEFPSLPRSMDGNEMAYIVMDEAFKWTTSSPKETLESNIKVLMGRNRAGIVSMLSTMGDSDDYLRSVMDGCDIIARSNPKIRDENGNTLSELYEYFVSAIYSFDIPPDIFEIDKFGKVNKEKHLEYINNKINKLDKNSKSYIFEKRRLPLIKEDALLSAQLVTYFSKPRINSRLNALRAMTPDDKMSVYVRGNLIERKGKVEFEVDLENGIWLVSCLPYFSSEKNIDTRNRFTINNGNYFPPVNPECVIGYDPIRYKKEDTKSSSLSRASAFIRKKFDYFGTGIVDIPCALLVYRPDDPRDAHREVIKACKFWGCSCMHERQVESVKDEFELANMMPFLMKNDKDNLYGIWTDSAGKIVKNGVDMLVTRYSPPKTPEEIDQIENYPFEEGLKDLDSFDMANTTQFDITMSEIMCEHGLKQLLQTNKTSANAAEFINQVYEVIAPRNHMHRR